MNKKLRLCDLKPGEKAQVINIKTKGSMRRRFLDIGLVNTTEVECVGISPLGDPAAYIIRGGLIAIRSGDCKEIYISKI